MKWEIRPLGKVSTILPGRHLLESDHNKMRSGVPYLTGPSDFGIYQAKPSRWTQKPDVMCQPGDVLVTVKGSGVASTNLAPEVPACIGRQLMAVRALDGISHSEYLSLALQGQRSVLRDSAIGATVPGLSIEHLESLRIPVPPLPEQRRIAARLREQLAEVEKARTALQAQLDAAEKLPEACLRSHFDNAASKTWPSTRLGGCVRLINGRAYSQHELLTKGTPVIRIQNLNGGKRWYYSDLDLPEEKLCVEGDLLFAWSATFGPYIWAGPKAIYHYHIWKVVPFSHMHPRFTYYLLRWITESIRANSHGIAMLHMTKEGMENWQLKVPEYGHQKAIAAELDALRRPSNHLFSDLQTRLDALEQLPAALLREVFSSSGKALP